jgi:hypothetical protein
LISIGVRKYITPYYWGNPWFAAKIKHIKKNNISTNTIFIGSSRVYRQINPQLFDSLTQATTKSYNLGAPATFCPQTYYLLENILNDTLLNIKYCFIELSGIDEISDYLLHQERSNYWVTPNYLTFIYSSLLDNSSYPLKKKWKIFSTYTTSFIENVFHLGHFKEQLLNKNYYNHSYTGEYGFYPLEKEFKETQDSIVKNIYRNRHLSLLKDTSQLIKRKQLVSNYIRKKDASNCSLTHLKKIKQLIEECNEKGVKLYFMLLPRNTIQTSYSLYFNIPEENTINLANPKEFPEFYLVENSFDIGHLNIKGANLLTKELAKSLTLNP